jgi:hypothetical protein
VDGGRRSEEAIKLLEAALRGGLADLDALVLMVEVLQRGILVGDDIVEAHIFGLGELERVLDGVGLGSGPLEDVPEARDLIADDTLRFDELGVLLAHTVHRI